MVVGDDGSWDVPEPDIAVPAWAVTPSGALCGWARQRQQHARFTLAARASCARFRAASCIRFARHRVRHVHYHKAAASREILCIRRFPPHQQMLLRPLQQPPGVLRTPMAKSSGSGRSTTQRLDPTARSRALRERVIGGEEVLFTADPLLRRDRRRHRRCRVQQYRRQRRRRDGAAGKFPFVAVVRLAETSGRYRRSSPRRTAPARDHRPRDAIIVGLAGGRPTRRSPGPEHLPAHRQSVASVTSWTRSGRQRASRRASRPFAKAWSDDAAFEAPVLQGR